jgi:hypothetical protein
VAVEFGDVGMVMASKDEIYDIAVVLRSHVLVFEIPHMVQGDYHITILLLFQLLRVFLQSLVVVEIIQLVAIDLRTELIKPCFFGEAKKTNFETLILEYFVREHISNWSHFFVRLDKIRHDPRTVRLGNELHRPLDANVQFVVAEA